MDRAAPNIGNNEKCILIVDEDRDDWDTFREIFGIIRPSLLLKFIPNGKDALHYLVTAKGYPALIISDIHIPCMNGFEFRRALLNNQRLRNAAIPFVFLTLASSMINKVVSRQLQVTGVFEKASSFSRFRMVLEGILASSGM